MENLIGRKCSYVFNGKLHTSEITGHDEDDGYVETDCGWFDLNHVAIDQPSTNPDLMELCMEAAEKHYQGCNITVETIDKLAQIVYDTLIEHLEA